MTKNVKLASKKKVPWIQIQIEYSRKIKEGKEKQTQNKVEKGEMFFRFF